MLVVPKGGARTDILYLKDQMSHSKVRQLRVRKRMGDIPQNDSAPPSVRIRRKAKVCVVLREKALSKRPGGKKRKA